MSNLLKKIDCRLTSLKLPTSAEMSLHNVEPHIGLYANNEWVCWVTKDEAVQLENEMGVRYE